MKKSIEVQIHGQSFRLRTEAKESYVKDLARYVNGAIQQVNQNQHPVQPMDRAAMMAALQITDRFFQLKHLDKVDRADTNARLLQLINATDQLLDNLKES